ncbi:MAG TPA: hypothetical protein VM469_01885 [Pseudoxanthomonas sp.]|nr:hypothetical protein [Pseudoxanthomonas sp.]
MHAKYGTIWLGLSLMLGTQAHAAEIAVSAASNKGSGQLPSGYELVNFQTYDGNWTPDVYLPTQPRQGDRVVIRTRASYPSVLHAAATNLNVEKLQLRPGDQLELTYDAKTKQWRANGNVVANYRPVTTGAAIPETHPYVSTYEMWDTNWTRLITLPAKAKDGDVIAISSQATLTAQINPANILFASSLHVFTGDRYAFVYRADLGKWALRIAPSTQEAPVAALPSPRRPRTVVALDDTRWVGRIALPKVAGNRDRVIIRSSAKQEAVIGNENTNSASPMRLYAGAEYEFVFTRENNRWERVRQPQVVLNAVQMPTGIMPALKSPTTIVRSWNGNHTPVLTLPAGYGAGTRVIVDTQAARPIQVVANATRHSVTPGERVSFLVDASGKWQRETRTIDLLLLYSSKTVAYMSDSAARARMYESFQLTNEALENSGANFRYRLAALRAFPALANWKELAHPLAELRSNATAQAWRNAARADGIYYEGSEAGCGLAWVNADQFSMVATGSISCGTTVMRHEMGHNMSLYHGGTPGAGYRQGYLPAHTVMAGNAVPYYATPTRLSQEDGIWMGIANQYDAVRAMNEKSAQVAAYR